MMTNEETERTLLERMELACGKKRIIFRPASVAKLRGGQGWVKTYLTTNCEPTVRLLRRTTYCTRGDKRYTRTLDGIEIVGMYPKGQMIFHKVKQILNTLETIGIKITE